MTILTTSSGIDIDITAPREEDIIITDIAHSLSMICRYNGTTKYHYSVAQHCIAVTKVVAKLGGGVEAQLYALLHDATEAYICDIPRPLKEMLPDYRAIEHNLNIVIMSKMGLLDISDKDKDIVAAVDYNIVYDEVSEVLESMPSWMNQYESVTTDRTLFRVKPSHIVRDEWLALYNDLIDKRGE